MKTKSIILALIAVYYMQPSTVFSQSFQWSLNSKDYQLLSKLPSNYEYQICNTGETDVVISYDHVDVRMNDRSNVYVPDHIDGTTYAGQHPEMLRVGACFLIYGKHILAKPSGSSDAGAQATGTLEIVNRNN